MNNSTSCTNCGYAAKRKNPDCGDHPTEMAKHVDNLVRDYGDALRDLAEDDRIMLTGKEYLEAIAAAEARGARAELETINGLMDGTLAGHRAVDDYIRVALTQTKGTPYTPNI